MKTSNDLPQITFQLQSHGDTAFCCMHEPIYTKLKKLEHMGLRVFVSMFSPTSLEVSCYDEYNMLVSHEEISCKSVRLECFNDEVIIIAES